MSLKKKKRGAPPSKTTSPSYDTRGDITFREGVYIIFRGLFLFVFLIFIATLSIKHIELNTIDVIKIIVAIISAGIFYIVFQDPINHFLELIIKMGEFTWDAIDYLFDTLDTIGCIVIIFLLLLIAGIITLLFI